MVNWVMSLSVGLDLTLNLISLTTLVNAGSEGVKKGLEAIIWTH
jgi:hypothetical protein